MREDKESRNLKTTRIRCLAEIGYETETQLVIMERF